MEQNEDGALLHNLLLFGRLLHGLGLEVNPDRMIDVQEALQHVPIGHKRDFFYTLRSFLVKRREDLPLFDQAFELFWRKPAGDAWEMNLAQMLAAHGAQQQNQKQEQPLIRAPEAQSPDDALSAADDQESQEVVELTRTYSAREVLRRKDFAQLTPSELLAVKQLMATLVWQMGMRTTRRYVPGRAGMLDLRRSLRRNLRHGGDLLVWSHRMPKVKPRPLVVIADISGSMEQYTRLLLHFIYGMANELQRQGEVFVFGTRLTRITRQLRHNDADRALQEVTAVVKDWSGGTRIGDALKTFNYDWGRRVLHGRPIVLVISDGWDQGDPSLLSKEIGRLQRSCDRLIWLNPLLGGAQYEPLTRGMQAALPHIDDFLPVHNLASLEDLGYHLGRLGDKVPAAHSRIQLRGAAFIRGRKG